jgi:molybdopterin/thiamine biosynthesis adenylyltransferase
MLLGQAGVGRFLLVDCDALDVSNVSRHVLDLSDVGRRKVDALAERLRLRGAQCSAHDLDLTTTDPMRLAEILTACGLVVCTVDVPSASFIVNEVLVEHAVAGLFAGAYEEAAAGEIIAVRPGGGHCLYCAVGFRTGLIPEVNVRARQEAYRNADSARLVAEPGLAIDITYLASVAAAHALALLDPSGNRAQLLGSGFSLVHGPSAPRASNPFRAPMDFLHARVSRSEQCPVCRSPVAAR